MARLIKDKLPPLNPEENIIGKKISQIRKEKGLTQKQLSEKIGIKRALLSDYELGRVRIYAEMVVRLAIALEVSTDKLLGLERKKEENTPPEPSVRLMKRIHRINKLPASKQKSLLQIIDGFLNSEGV